MSGLPRLQKLHYSTWGLGFFSEHWLTELNAWMLSLVKLVEANIDLDKASHVVLQDFTKLAGSDYMFVYDDPRQQSLVREKFLAQYNQVEHQLSFSQRSILHWFPIDPFKGFFAFATLDPVSELDNESASVAFQLTKLSHESRSDPVIHRIATEHGEYAGVHVYSQYFMLQPNQRYRCEVVGIDAAIELNSPDFGSPFYVGSGLTVKRKYDDAKMQALLERLWGPVLRVQYDESRSKRSRALHRGQDFETVLAGRRAAIFSYNKEFFGVLKFRELADFDIACVFDSEVTLQDAGEWINSEDTGVSVLSDIAEVKAQSYDALIFTGTLNFDSECALFEALVEEAVSRDIPIVSLYNDVLHYSFVDSLPIKPENFYVAGIDTPLDVSQSEFDQSASSRCVLAVFGTDSVQGKFSTQLYLREALKSKLNVAHWSTEPTGPLLGADVGFSRAYGGITDTQWRQWERKALHDIQACHDIVLTGGQNSMVFAPPGKDKSRNVSTEIFARFLPRWVVLTVAVDTAEDKIQESLDYIRELAAQHSVETDVLAFAMLDGQKIIGGKWTETYFTGVEAEVLAAKKMRISQVFSLPVYCLPEHAENLADHVQRTVAG